jgi:hypothetical protein
MVIYFSAVNPGRGDGGDDRFRPATLSSGARQGAFTILGNPDHTTVFVEDTVPRCIVADGESAMSADFGVLGVVE